MKLLQGIHDGEEAVGRKGGQGENGHPYRDVLRSFRELTDQLAPRPRLQRVDHGREGNAGYDHQEVGQRQRENVP